MEAKSLAASTGKNYLFDSSGLGVDTKNTAASLLPGWGLWERDGGEFLLKRGGLAVNSFIMSKNCQNS